MQNMTTGLKYGLLTLGGSYRELALAVAVFVLVLAAAYYFTKLIARPGGLRRGKNLKIVEILPLSATQSVAIVQAGTRFLVVGLSKDGIISLGEVSEDELLLENLQENGGLKGFLAGFGKSSALPSSFDTVLHEAEDKDRGNNQDKEKDKEQDKTK